jgi:hypothetical protein
MMSELKVGVKSNDVVSWQMFLRGRSPYSNIEITGLFDEQTLMETKEFQSICDLNESGVVDQSTLDAALKCGFVGLQLNNEVPLTCLSLEDKYKLFGKFSYVADPIKGSPENIKITDNWVKNNISSVNIKQLIGKTGCKTGSVLLHKKCIKQVVDFFDALEKEKLNKKIITFDGAWVPRFVIGSKTNLSNHSWGTAFDINAGFNPLGVVPKEIGQQGSVKEFVAIAERFGIFWGGNYKSRPDGMHFEVVKLL